MTKRIGLTVFFLLALLALDTRSTSQYAAQSQPRVPEHVSDEVIVRFRDGVDESRKDLARFRVSGSRKKVFKTVRGLEVIKLPRNVSVQEAIDLYEQDPDVLYAEPNYILHLTAKSNLTATPNDPSFGSLWGLTKISAPSAWNITTGSSNAVVAVIDTGIDYNHPDLAANMFRNTADCNSNGIDDDGNGYIDDCFGIDVANGDSDPMDDHYHGTHVAGTIGAVGNNGIGVVGVNWNVKLLACKFFDASGSATTEGAIECLEYVKDMKARGVNIVATNNSWGGDENSQALYDAIAEQRQLGILFISGAGNGNAFGVGQNNDTTPFYPCNYFLANIICVAATRSTDAKAGFSNYGRRTVHVGAPGQGILSTVPGGGYTSLDGTSMATPHVAGLAALLNAQDPNRDWRVIKNLILAGGNTISSMANTITGKRINANGAMTCSNSSIQTRVQPVASTISASPGVPVVLASLNINCANPNGNVVVSVSPGSSSVTLLDNGASADQAAADGIYSGQWTPSAAGTYTLTFPGNDKITVNVANPTISVTPNSIDFDGVAVGSSIDKSLTVHNTGGGILSGTATTSGPYSIVSGGTYNLSGGQSQIVTVRFAPTASGTFAGSVNFTGGDGASVTVSGFTTVVNSITPSNVDLAAPPSSFTVQGTGFKNFGYGLPVVNWQRNGVNIAQARATAMTSTTLTVPYPTDATSIGGPRPGLSVGDATVVVYNQSGTNSFTVIGTLPFTITDTRPPTSVTSITPSSVDLASPPSSFTVQGSGFANLGYGLPVVNWQRNGVNIAQARATAMTSTTLTVPYPTDATSIGGPRPGLSVGSATVVVYHQTGTNSFTVIGTLPFTITNSQTTNVARR